MLWINQITQITKFLYVIVSKKHFIKNRTKNKWNKMRTAVLYDVTNPVINYFIIQLDSTWLSSDLCIKSW